MGNKIQSGQTFSNLPTGPHVVDSKVSYSGICLVHVGKDSQTKTQPRIKL